MKSYRIIYIALSFMTMTSCHTALNIPPVEKLQGDFGKPNMEFIGFINAPRSEICPKTFRNFGRELERNNIAVNRQVSLGSSFYMEDLSNFSASSRYVSFVNILDIGVEYDNDIKDNNGLFLAGLFVGIFTAFSWIPVYLPMMLAADKNYCQQYVRLQAELCIYDTEKKELSYVIPIDFNHVEVYKGQSDHKKTDTWQLEASGRNILTNALLEYYGQAHEYVQKLTDSKEGNTEVSSAGV